MNLAYRSLVYKLYNGSLWSLPKVETLIAGQKLISGFYIHNDGQSLLLGGKVNSQLYIGDITFTFTRLL